MAAAVLNQRPGWRSPSFWLVVAALAAFVVVLYRTAWLCDDALITLRTVDNFLGGHGLRWNVADRVQISTHPLWMFVVSGFVAVTGEFYYTVLAVAGGLSIVVLLLIVFRVAVDRTAAVVGAVALLFSGAFVDFSTGGLEDSLTHLLLVLFFLACTRNDDQSYRRVALIAGIAALSRIDAILLFVPALLLLPAGPLGRRARSFTFGMAPFVAWLAFAFFYFGTPFPMPAYAKAFCHGVPAGDLAAQSLHYFAWSMKNDPITLPLIAGGVLLAFWRRQRGEVLAAVGVLLYLAYIVKVGGDFMGGRFFTSPLVIAVCLLVRVPWGQRPAVAAICAVGVGLGAFMGPNPTFTTGPKYVAIAPDEHGIGNERAMYYPLYGLRSPKRAPLVAGGIGEALAGDGHTLPIIAVRGGLAGTAGFFGGPEVHLVDPMLIDPLLARLPIKTAGEWRIGHFERRIPEGYLETLKRGDVALHHAGLARYYERLRFVTRGPLWSWQRLSDAFSLLVGGGGDDLRAFVESDYRKPPRPVVLQNAVARRIPDSTPWSKCHVIYDGGLEVRFNGVQSARRLEVGLNAQHAYELVFLSGSTEVGRTKQQAVNKPLGGVSAYQIEVPTTVTSGFDRVLVLPSPSLDSIYALSFLRLLK
ncbi:MAG: hypothetical protein CMJ85_09945 [Planctomycetes bacterium]|nr:hypothetical protein [Planctomycetota bacterium]